MKPLELIDELEDEKPDIDSSSESSSSPLPPSPCPQKAKPSTAKSKASTTPTKKKASGSVKEEVIGSPSKPPVVAKAKPAKAGSGGSSSGGTNITMAAEVSKHAISLLTAEELRIVAERVNADPIKLRDSWRKRWLPRLLRAIDAEFTGDVKKGE